MPQRMQDPPVPGGQSLVIWRHGSWRMVNMPRSKPPSESSKSLKFNFCIASAWAARKLLSLQMQQGSMASSVNRKITSAVCGHLIAMKDVLVVLQLPENTLPLQKDKLPTYFNYSSTTVCMSSGKVGDATFIRFLNEHWILNRILADKVINRNTWMNCQKVDAFRSCDKRKVKIKNDVLVFWSTSLLSIHQKIRHVTTVYYHYIYYHIQTYSTYCACIYSA